MKEIKNSVLFFSILFGLTGIVFTILMSVEYNRISNIVEQLEQRVKEQTLLIEFLQGDNNE